MNKECIQKKTCKEITTFELYKDDIVGFLCGEFPLVLREAVKAAQSDPINSRIEITCVDTVAPDTAEVDAHSPLVIRIITETDSTEKVDF